MEIATTMVILDALPNPVLLLDSQKTIERVGDHTTGIAEQVHFMVHGKMPADERPKEDNSSSTIVTLEDGKNLKEAE